MCWVVVSCYFAPDVVRFDWSVGFCLVLVHRMFMRLNLRKRPFIIFTLKGLWADFYGRYLSSPEDVIAKLSEILTP